MVKLVNRAKMTIASGGAGNITLGTAVDGYQTFADAGVSDANVVRYTIEDGDDWEIGTGVYTASGTTLVRTVTESSNSDAALTCSADAVIFVTIAAEDLAGNAAPIWITTPSSELDLEVDGLTAVTLSGEAIDEFPVHYSWDGYSGTTVYNDSNLPPQLVSAPTFSGGTVSLIGSSNSSNGGSFNFRMKASDGVKTATAITAVNLNFGYYISNASYDNLSFSTLSQDSFATDMAFNSDGTKMFILGRTGDRVYQYSLTNPFSLASENVSYDSLFFGVASQASTPTGLAFNSDGTKMFILDNSSSKVYQYSLTNGFSLASENVSYDSLFLSVGDSSPQAIRFNPDGTKIFIVGRSNKRILRYSLTNGFSLASGNVVSGYDIFNLPSTLSPLSVNFNPDGTRMFVQVDTPGDEIYQYSLTNGFSLASGNVSDDNIDFDVSAGATNPYSLTFNSDGSKMFIVCPTTDKIYQYSSTA